MKDSNFWRQGCVYDIGGDGFMSTFLPPNLSNCTYYYAQLPLHQSYLNKVVFKKRNILMQKIK